MDNGALPEGLNSHKIEDSDGFDRWSISVAPTAFRRPPMPPELIDTIIDMLHTDRAVLATCALVSRSWLPASRYHLFSKVTITRQSSPVISKLLSSPRCTIASAVRHLALHTIEDLSQSICGLSNVTQMSLRGFMLYRTSIFPPSVLIPLLGNIESLRVEDVFFGRNGAFLLALLHHTPQLQSLLCNDLGGIGEEAVQTPSLPEVELTPRLKSLQVYSDDRPVQLEWFVAWWKSTIPPLAVLVLEFHGAAELNKLVALFEAVGSSLQVFELCGSPHDLCEYPSTVALSCDRGSGLFGQPLQLLTSHSSPDCNRCPSNAFNRQMSQISPWIFRFRPYAT
jgi:hypothetical protein